MTGILDVSGAMEILLQKEKAGQLSAVLQEASLVLAPDLYISELANTLWKYHRAAIFTKDECLAYIHNGIHFVDQFIASNELWKEAFAEGINNNHSIYDMLYLVAARRNDGIVLTVDSVLTAICKKNNIRVCS